MHRAFALILLALAAALTPGTARASSVFSTEVVLAAELSEREGLTGEATGSQRSAVGFEWFGTAGGDRGDVVRFDLQVRVSHDAEEPGRTGPGLEVHNAWLDYRLSLGRTVRLGHFSPAFGLEPDVDTHGTLLQTQAGPDLGFKKDWGVAWMSLLGPGDLTVALQTGSGAALDRRDRSRLASARFTFPGGPNTTIGLAALSGRTLAAPGARTLPLPDFAPEAVERSRAGMDILRDAGNTRAFAELSVGEDDGEGRASLLARVERTPVSLPRLRVAAQARFGKSGGDAFSALSAGVEYRLSDFWSASAALVRDDPATGPHDLRLQFLLYRFRRHS